MKKERFERQFNIDTSILNWKKVEAPSDSNWDIKWADVGPYTVWNESGNYYVSRNNSRLQWRVDLSQYM